MINKINRLFLAIILATGLVACSSDDFMDGYEGSSSSSISKEKVEVTFNIGVQEPQESTRVSYESGTTGENMYSWFVIVAESDKVVAIVNSGSISDLEQDSFDFEATTGTTYDFYSFANISRTSISELASLAVGSDMPDLSNVTYTVNGNGFDISSNHIPMSNHQQITIESTSTEYSLWVVRMLAKMELQFTNVTDADITITSATLSEVTDNVNNNLMLMPTPDNYADQTACTPNLSSSATTIDYTYEETVTVASGETKSMTFYVNESATPTANAHGLFTLTLNCSNGDYYRYALITNDDDNWDFIARNDYRVIPITLQEYYLDIELQDWPPIGVTSSIVKGEDGLFTATFHAAGHFHIVPVVKKYGTDTALDYGTDADEWAISTWKNVSYPDDFYETDESSEVDECENGGVPVWDDTNHFFFGYLKDTGTDDAESKAYLDFSINVYTGGTPAYRTLTYHLCIVKDLAY